MYNIFSPNRTSSFQSESEFTLPKYSVRTLLRLSSVYAKLSPPPSSTSFSRHTANLSRPLGLLILIQHSKKHEVYKIRLPCWACSSANGKHHPVRFRRGMPGSTGAAVPATPPPSLSVPSGLRYSTARYRLVARSHHLVSTLLSSWAFCKQGI